MTVIVCLRFCVNWLGASFQTCLKKEPRAQASGAQVSDNYVKGLCAVLENFLKIIENLSYFVGNEDNL